MFNKPNIKANNLITVRYFDEKVKFINTQLKSFLPTEYMVKVVNYFSNHLRNSFYQSYLNIILERIIFVSFLQFKKLIKTFRNYFTMLSQTSNWII